MSDRETAAAIDRLASEWLARLDARELDEAERGDFERWLDADPRHEGAFLRAQAVWTMLDRPVALGLSSADERLGIWRRIAKIGAAARGMGGVAYGRVAMIALLIATGAFSVGVAITEPGWERIETRQGEIRQVPLGDGSVVVINTRSSLKVGMQSRTREVKLGAGEAWFEVAKDRTRPFKVTVGDVRVQAVGTAFAVRRLVTGADVLVTEGAVAAWSINGEGKRARVPAGSRLFISNIAGPMNVVDASASIERNLAWRSGHIQLDGQTLAEAADEFNRYNRVQIVVPDPDLAHEELVGRLRINEPQSFARAAAQTLDAEISIVGEQIFLTRKKSSPLDGNTAGARHLNQHAAK